MGFFSNLGTEAYDRKYNDRDLLLRIGRYFRPQVGRLIVIGICLILVSLAGAAAPIVVALSVDLIGDDLSLLNISLIAAAVLLTGLVDGRIEQFTDMEAVEGNLGLLHIVRRGGNVGGGHIHGNQPYFFAVSATYLHVNQSISYGLLVFAQG